MNWSDHASHTVLKIIAWYFESRVLMVLINFSKYLYALKIKWSWFSCCFEIFCWLWKSSDHGSHIVSKIPVWYFKNLVLIVLILISKFWCALKIKWSCFSYCLEKCMRIMNTGFTQYTWIFKLHENHDHLILISDQSDSNLILPDLI